MDKVRWFAGIETCVVIPQDTILTAVWTQLNSHTGLRSILGATGRVVKGAKRPDALPNPVITFQMPVAVMAAGTWHGTNALRRTLTEPIYIAVFVDNVPNGAIDVTTLSTICANIGTIAATAKPVVTGATVHQIGQYVETGPLYDPQDPNEAYRVITMGYWISET